ncbi:glycosyltransferase family 4 protein [Thermosediminibacter litoriperuensis]|uniref:Glycosyltransferase involved in cell wall biosynthesis n=1 Tax=Thermosediminibacter litoriperuensis TaxID=291989 RepID=A0A5S5AZA9_9FIRM|nr:glycosyltransferase family 4 protein [Thermosediminibacter litoriperuensis]TYP57817.1 glycosyltransferase involved in cell wall biosynthesis [Thermosediminibacter litoriperuensis]
MRRVLHVITDTNIGGAGRYLLNLLSAWDIDRYDIAVACPAGGELEKRLKSLGVRVFPLDGGEKSFRISHVRELLRIIAREKIDLVHTHASLSGRIAGRLSGCRVILTRHWMGQKNEMGFVRRLINRIVYRLLTDRVIAVSRAVKVSLIDIGAPAGIIKTVYNGIQLPAYSGELESTIRQELGIPENTPLIGIVARLVPEKGHEFAIRAMPGILERFPGARLILVGDGPHKGYLEDLCEKLQVKDKVIFLGFRKDVENVAGAFDVVLMPSVNEALGLALLETMALGKPVIASEVGGIPEVIKNGYNGILVPPGNVEVLTEKVIELLCWEELRRSLGREAKDTIYRKFTARIMAEKTMEVYDEIIGSKGR